MLKWIAIWGVVAIGSAIAAGVLAGIKRRDHSFWAAWSFVFPPMLLVLLVLSKNQGPKKRQPTLDEEDAAGAS
ncbi:MAG: hypothetical protein ABL904_26885 [Hyphomicrobiaceae bacterium]